MSTYLITLSEIQERQPVSTNIDPGTLNPYILMAQNFGLRQLMGDDLYNRVVTEVSGGSPSAGVVALEPYYVEYLAYKVSALLFNFSSTQITRTGITRKTTTVSEPVDVEEMRRMQGTMDSFAATAGEYLLKFVCDNIGDYPEANTNTLGMPAGVVIEPRFSTVRQQKSAN